MGRLSPGGPFDSFAYAAASRALRHSAADSCEINLREPTLISRGPKPIARILKYMDCEMR